MLIGKKYKKYFIFLNQYTNSSFLARKIVESKNTLKLAAFLLTLLWAPKHKEYTNSKDKNLSLKLMRLSEGNSEHN